MQKCPFCSQNRDFQEFFVAQQFGMSSKRYRPWNPDQMVLFPQAMKDALEEEARRGRDEPGAGSVAPGADDGTRMVKHRPLTASVQEPFHR
jgi:hypothetical protein